MSETGKSDGKLFSFACMQNQVCFLAGDSIKIVIGGHSLEASFIIKCVFLTYLDASDKGDGDKPRDKGASDKGSRPAKREGPKEGTPAKVSIFLSNSCLTLCWCLEDRQSQCFTEP